MNKRRHWAHLFLALLLAVAAAPLSTLGAFSSSQKRFDPEGQFNPIGNAPKGLEEVASIDLFRSGRGRPFTSHTHSGVVTTRGAVYRFQSISASQNSLTFTTRARAGTSYRFTGRFLKGGVYAEMDSSVWDQPLLEGTLSKFKNGKKIAESRMRFSYFGGT
ncbi:MAG: hypothetical protein ICV60_12300 [Pyrinomonadaceae bacterium]|nr:hypothetical protein [Pyrinomonadaceae bacterium]